MTRGGLSAAPAALTSSWQSGAAVELGGASEVALFVTYTPADAAGAATVRVKVSRDGDAWYYVGAADNDSWTVTAPYGRVPLAVLELTLPASGTPDEGVSTHTTVPVGGARWVMIEAAETGAPSDPGELAVTVVRC